MAEPWTTAAHRLFKKHNIRTVGYVPDAGLTELIKSCHADNDIKSVVMTTEEEGIGLSSGAWLGGEKAEGLIVFDEGYKKIWDGEKKAIEYFLKIF